MACGGYSCCTTPCSSAPDVAYRDEYASVRRARPALGTLVEIRCEARSNDAAHQAIDAALAAIERVHKLMSFHDEASDVSRLNARAHREAVKVDAQTWSVLAAALELHRYSSGAFDVSVASRLVAEGLLPARGEPIVNPGTSADIVMLPKSRVRFRRPLLIDLGGIAKGRAVDAAIDVLYALGIPRAVVNAGGDLRVLGDEPQVVHLRHPGAPTRLVPALTLARGAIATTADYFSRAVIDPATGARPASGGSVSVIAPTAMEADALTKVVALRGDRASAVLNHYDARAVVLAELGGHLGLRWLPDART
jgi:FAD:protein FMN transferase